MKSLIFSAVLLVFSATYAQGEETYQLKVNSTCGSCIKKLNKSVCEPFKSSLTECSQKVGSMTLKGKNIDLAAVKKAIADAGYEVQSSEKQEDHSHHDGH